MANPVIVAIDGPSGTGKSSTSRAVAAKLGLSYLDTGAQYRAMTWWMLSNGVDVNDPVAVADSAGKPVIVSGTDPSAAVITVDGEDAAEPIRTQEVTAAVSAVSAVPEVRARMVELQRAAAAAAPAGIVVEGRDIGTTVFPGALAKIYLTASAEARAARRSGELKGAQSVADTRAALIKRDAADSGRTTSPLAKAGDAVEVDTTELTLEQVIECIVTLVEEKRAALWTNRLDTLPSRRGAAAGRLIGIGLMRSAYRPRVLGAWRVPAQGPIILAVNHSHNVDGPMLFAASPRPVHFLVKKEAFIGPLGTFLHAIGQVEVDRATADRTAITAALGVLESGGVLGIFPEGTRGDGDFAELRAGLAYFAVRSGAPVVPVAVLGSVRSGRLVPALPPLRARVDVVFGDPFAAAESGGRRTRSALDTATALIQKRLAAHLAEARQVTGR